VNLADLLSVKHAGLLFVIIFLGLIIGFTLRGRGRILVPRRKIHAFDRLRDAIGLGVESGSRLHISLGWGGLLGIPGIGSLIGLSIAKRVAKIASISDKPPVITSGEGATAVLSRDTLQAAYRELNQQEKFDSVLGRMSGVTPFSYAAGTLPVIYDETVSATIVGGHLGSEVGLITDATQRIGGVSLTGSDNLPAQAVMFGTTQEALIGEDYYAVDAFLDGEPVHTASLQAQDILRWVVASGILIGALLKFFGLI